MRHFLFAKIFYMCISLIHYQCISVIIYVYMKSFLKLSSKLLFTLTILFLQASSASAYCIGQPVTLSWSVTSGVATACPVHSSAVQECRFDEAASAFTSSKTITAPNGGCTVNFQCSNASGNSNLGSATLSVDSSQVWNGSSCVVPAVAVAGVCGSTANACDAGTLGVNNIQGNGDYHWYCNGTNGGATSPLCFYVPPPAVVTWTRYCTPVGDANPNQFW